MKKLNIALGISGGIAAYKSVEIVRALQKRGVEDFEIIMTRNSSEFIGPMTFEALTGKRPHLDTFESGRALSHIHAVEGIDVLAIAPATANIIGKFANGIADDFLSTCYLANTGSVLIAPAMNCNMMDHPATQRNLDILKKDGVIVLESDSGFLACGYEGRGRMPDPVFIAEQIEYVGYRRERTLLKGKKVVITSGGTEEAIDPVRTITNRSTGKMGAEMARTFSFAGADVTVITGNHTVRYPSFCKVIEVSDALSMKQAVFAEMENTDVLVMAAAVSDFTPEQKMDQKIKKDTKTTQLDLSLIQTDDILKTCSTRFGKNRVIIGFAAETQNVVENGQKKLRDKGADMIIANQVGLSDSGFGSDTNTCWIIEKEQPVRELGTVNKSELAYLITEHTLKLIKS